MKDRVLYVDPIQAGAGRGSLRDPQPPVVPLGAAVSRPIDSFVSVLRNFQDNQSFVDRVPSPDGLGYYLTALRACGETLRRVAALDRFGGLVTQAYAWADEGRPVGPKDYT